jgi:nucleotide-binding universal stress UspA family protein
MFQKILVPLDGSILAESVLPAVGSLASTLESSVTLIHVIEENPPEAIHNDRHLARPEEAEAYLAEIARNHFPGSTKVNTHVHDAGVKDVAGSLSSHAAEYGSDLVVMCTHGRTGVREMLFGSIAQKVIAAGGRPVLLLRPVESAQPAEFQLRRILLPLDRESIHDDVLPFAIGLARAYQAELALLTIILTFGTLSGEQAAASTLLPGTTAALLDIEEEATREHLQGHLVELKDHGLSVSMGIARGDPASEIVAAGARWKADLLILATHRKAGLDAFWARSVAPNVARTAHQPLLLLPLG